MSVFVNLFARERAGKNFRSGSTEAMMSADAEPAVFAPSRHDRAQYEILRVVNRGGMGEIALGRARGTKGFDKLVVLKRLRADAEREDHLQMFDVEQEVMSKIEHPNIVKVFDQPLIESIPYLAMEYIRGRNLDQVIRAASQSGQALSLRFALSVVSEVLRGLAFVHRLKDNDGHALGVVHQDMTPSNVLVSFFGEVKITDFGISYVTSRDGGLRKGVLKGKPRYVAPEVLAGKRVNNRADIYGVGAVLFELLKGRALFARATVKETLAAVARNELPDFKEEFKNEGDGVAQLFIKSMAKDPNDRYRTAEAMAADVLNELVKLGGPMPPPNVGYLMRQFFARDPDVPEMDPDLEQAMAQDSLPPQTPALNLDETLLELDRLLGDETSVDLFTLPPELEAELGDLEDGDPFLAQTPIPDFVWGAETEAEVLERANLAFGPPTDGTSKPNGQAAETPPPRMPPPASAEAGRYAIHKPTSDTEGESISALAQPAPRGANPKSSSATALKQSASITGSATQRTEIVAPAREGPPFWLGLLVGFLAGAIFGLMFLAKLLG